MDDLTNFCKHCSASKPLEAFARKHDGKHGRAVKCKLCSLDYIRRWREENPERAKAGQRSYYERNREEVTRKAGEWQRNNPERANAKNRQWAARNVESARASSRINMAKRRAGGRFTRADVAEMRELQSDRCIACRVDLCGVFHVDHILSISKGGTNDRSNLQLLCPTCNMRKGAKDNAAFMLAIVQTTNPLTPTGN